MRAVGARKEGVGGMNKPGESVSAMKRAIAVLDQARKGSGGAAVAAAPAAAAPAPDAVDPITALRRWRLAAGVRFVGKSLHAKGQK